VKFDTAACLRSARWPARSERSNEHVSSPSGTQPACPLSAAGLAGPRKSPRDRPASTFLQLLAEESPGIPVGLRDIFQYLPSASVPGLALRALILHYINKGLKNQGCRGKRIGVVEASRYSANTRLPSPSIFLPRCVFHLRAKGYYTSGVESAIARRARGAQARKENLAFATKIRQR